MNHPLSLTTDFITDAGNPQPHLAAIADAGFSLIHWCHQWNTDFLYGPAEIAAIQGWLRDCHLGVNDIHGSAGHEKNWGSSLEHERLAGIELVQNRIDFARALGTDVVVMHLPDEPKDAAQVTAYWDRLRKTLDALEPFARSRQVRLAMENMPWENFPTLHKVLAMYSPEFIGLCYDTGHGNMTPNGLDNLDRAKSRLIATHLHDNDGHGDQHLPMFAGTVDWPRFAAILKASSYAKPAYTIEASINNVAEKDPAKFLKIVRESALKFHELVDGVK